MQKTIAIVEIGGSHDECILSQLKALKKENFNIIFCSTKEMYNKNNFFHPYLNGFYEINFPKTMIGDFLCMYKLNQFFKKKNVNLVILNTAQGGHIRNLCLTSFSKIPFVGIIHTIKMLENSFTQSMISRKVKNYFVLNDTLKEKINNKSKNIIVESFYPLSFPSFHKSIAKPNNQIWIMIIGGVEYRRKDLDGFLDMVKSLSNDVHFYFIGKSNNELEEVQRFKKQIFENNLESRIHLFDDFVSQEDLDAYLQSADGILPLIHPNTASAQEYFTRQIPGAVNIAFSYKIPLLVHEKYNDWEDFHSSAIFYNLANFKQQFESFLKQKHLIKEKMILNPKFSENTQNKWFKNKILELLSTPDFRAGTSNIKNQINP